MTSPTSLVDRFLGHLLGPGWWNVNQASEAAILKTAKANVSGYLQPQGTIAAALQRLLFNGGLAQTMSGTAAAVEVPAQANIQAVMQPEGAVAAVLTLARCVMLETVPEGVVAALAQTATAIANGSVVNYSQVIATTQLTIAVFSGGQTFSGTQVGILKTAKANFVGLQFNPITQTNFNVTRQPIPVGATQVHIKYLVGAGGPGGSGAAGTATNRGGGGGGGGGAYIGEVTIPIPQNAVSYSIATGSSIAGQSAGGASYFIFHSTTDGGSSGIGQAGTDEIYRITAGGGIAGADANGSSAGSAGNGGSPSATGLPANITVPTYFGGSGGPGGSGSAGNGGNGNNASKGGGGGGGGGGRNSSDTNGSGGAGGSNSGASGGAGVSSGNGNSGGTATATTSAGGGGGGAAGGGSSGGTGGSLGGGGGGSGGGSSPVGRAGGQGGSQIIWERVEPPTNNQVPYSVPFPVNRRPNSQVPYTVPFKIPS